MTHSPGEQIADRYLLKEQIAVGGMGEVWQAEDERLGRTVAIKVLKSEIGSDPEFLERFRGEARIAASLNHRGIAGVHDYGESVTPEGTPTAFIVMELVSGEPLSARLAAKGRLDVDFTLDLLEQAGRALQAAHEHGFVHRDVKPGNILLAEDGTVKLTDFGIAKAATSAPVTASGTVMGTAHYIAPEQARGLEAEPASDVYSLAVVGYECLAGRRPFSAEQPVDVAMMHINDEVPPLPEDLPENVRQLITSALVKDPRQRYADGGEFARAVKAVRRGLAPLRPSAATAWPPEAIAAPHSPSEGIAVATSATGASAGSVALGSGAGQPVPAQRTLAAPVRKGRSVMTVTFILLTVAAAAIGVFVVRDAVRADSETVPPPAPISPTAESVEVNLAGFAGRPLNLVQSELENGGLRPRARTVLGVPPSTPASCAVTDVRPVGAVPKGTAVTITCEQH